jgi:hypothetical protein
VRKILSLLAAFCPDCTRLTGRRQRVELRLPRRAAGRDAPVIIFNRSQLVMLPKAWVRGPLLASVNDELLCSGFRATNNNSGLVPTMVFTRDDHPDEKLTLTEKSSKTISDV